MAGGRVYEGCFVCPWHAWDFRLSDGRNPDNPSIQLPAYPSRVTESGEVQIGVGDSNTSASDPV